MLSDIQAQALRDQIIAAYLASSGEAAKTLDELTTDAMLNISDEQWQALSKELEEKKAINTYGNAS